MRAGVWPRRSWPWDFEVGGDPLLDDLPVVPAEQEVVLAQSTHNLASCAALFRLSLYWCGSAMPTGAYMVSR